VGEALLSAQASRSSGEGDPRRPELGSGPPGGPARAAVLVEPAVARAGAAAAAAVLPRRAGAARRRRLDLVAVERRAAGFPAAAGAGAEARDVPDVAAGRAAVPEGAGVAARGAPPVLAADAGPARGLPPELGAGGGAGAPGPARPGRRAPPQPLAAHAARPARHHGGGLEEAISLAAASCQGKFTVNTLAVSLCLGSFFCFKRLYFIFRRYTKCRVERRRSERGTLNS